MWDGVTWPGGDLAEATEAVLLDLKNAFRDEIEESKRERRREMRRRRMSRGKSKRSFKRGSRYNKKNDRPGLMRGGIRL